MLHNRKKHMAGSSKRCIHCIPRMCNQKDAAQQKHTHGRLPKEVHTLHAHDVQSKRCCTTEKNTWQAPQRGAYIAFPGCAIKKMLHNRNTHMAGSPKRCKHCMPMMCNQKDAAQQKQTLNTWPAPQRGAYIACP